MTHNLVERIAFLGMTCTLGMLCLTLVPEVFAANYDYEWEIQSICGRFNITIHMPDVDKNDPFTVDSAQNVYEPPAPGGYAASTDLEKFLISGRLVDNSKDGTMTGTITPTQGTGETLTWRLKILACNASKEFGGVSFSFEKIDLRTLYIGLTSTIIAATVVAAIFVRCARRREERQ